MFCLILLELLLFPTWVRLDNEEDTDHCKYLRQGRHFNCAVLQLICANYLQEMKQKLFVKICKILKIYQQ